MGLSSVLALSPARGQARVEFGDPSWPGEREPAGLDEDVIRVQAPAVPPPTGPATTPTVPTPPGGPGLAIAPPAAGTQPFTPPPATRRALGTSTLSRLGNPTMIGDQAPLTIQQVLPPTQVPGLPPPTPPGTPPPPPDPRLASAFVPSVRGFKIAENQSPQPQDRVFFTFNYFTDLNGALNRRFESPVANFRAYRYIFGLEKTFDDARGSFGLRLPLNTLTADPAISGRFARLGGTNTSLGDLAVFAKYILKEDPETGSLISAGLQVTPPTGPSRFADAPFITGIQSTQVEPFLGYLLVRDRFYLHGFTSMSVPTTIRDVTMVYNDIGVGYYAYRSPEPDRFLTGIIPTFEVHINTPLTHRDPFNPNDPAGTPDVVDLTYGVNVTFFNRAVLTFGAVTPVTGPRPFNTEYLLLFNLRFGAPRRAPAAALPFLGG